MSRTIRSRRAESLQQPFYARALRLRHLAPSGLLCFVFLEGAVALGVLLALAELVSWWGVLALPVTVALMVKFNDLVAGALSRAPAQAMAAAAPPLLSVRYSEQPTTVLPRTETPLRPAWAEQLDVRQQQVRQSAMRRYE